MGTWTRLSERCVLRRDTRMLIDWRTEADYRLLGGLDRAGLAWEWLRRDPAYVAATTTVGLHDKDPTDPVIVDAAEPSWSSHWGIHFRGTVGSASAVGADSLACGC
jgi:hypothetical protein